MSKRALHILWTGDADGTYNRDRVVLEGLRHCGHHIEILPFKRASTSVLHEIKRKGAVADLVYLPAFTHAQVRKVKSILPYKPLIFDPLVSRYLTKVYDYRQVWPYSIRALKNYFKDLRSMQTADLVLADTRAHQWYYHRTFGIPIEKMRVLPVGYCADDLPDEAPWTQKKWDPEHIVIAFYGSFAPLQGIPAIIGAARILSPHKHISFKIIGGGFEEKKVRHMIAEYELQNVDLLGWLPYDSMLKQINESQICLGIFGQGPKAQMVIPNKVFHYAGLGKPMITMDTPAIREIFSPGKNLEVSTGAPEELAQKIVNLTLDPVRAHQMGNEARKLVRSAYTQAHIGEMLSGYILETLKQ